VAVCADHDEVWLDPVDEAFGGIDGMTMIDDGRQHKICIRKLLAHVLGYGLNNYLELSLMLAGDGLGRDDPLARTATESGACMEHVKSPARE
jgi:hypothetical protein